MPNRPIVAYPEKSDVDEAFFTFTQRMFAADSIAAGNRPALATHDSQLIARIIAVCQFAGNVAAVAI